VTTEHTFTLTFEASGEVTPAHPEPDTTDTEPEPEEETTDG
jgi:hypothetical protein